MQYRLSNQVVLVRGKYGAALYDLRRSMIQGVPTSAADALEQGSCADDHPLLSRLADRSFLWRSDQAPHRGDFIAEADSPYFPLVRTVSFDLRVAHPLEHAATILRIVREASGFGLASVVLLVDQGSQAAVDVILPGLRAINDTLLVEALVDGPAADGFMRRRPDSYVSDITGSGPIGLHRASDGRGFARGARTLDAGIDPSLFISNYAYFHLLQRFGESYGCLHFDGGLGVYPDITESRLRIGTFGLDIPDIESLLARPELRDYWTFGKDKREKCRDCVFRYACPNPLSSRTTASDLSSRPRNCGLDLESGRWGPA